jgi:hypothetical protein
MQCAACGANLRPTHKICINCGAAVSPVHATTDIDVLDLKPNKTYRQIDTDNALEVAMVDQCGDKTYVSPKLPLIDDTMILELGGNTTANPLPHISASQATQKSVQVKTTTVEEFRILATPLGAFGSVKMFGFVGCAITLVMIIVGIILWQSMNNEDEPVRMDAQKQEVKQESVATVVPDDQSVINNIDKPQVSASSASPILVTTSKKLVVAKTSTNHPLPETNPPVLDSEPPTQTIVRESEVPKKTLDERYYERITTECKPGFIPGMVCREKIRWEMCEGRWSVDGNAGQLTCKGAAVSN